MQGRIESVIILYQCDQNDVTAAAAVIVTGIVIEMVIAVAAVAVIVMVRVVAIEAVLVMARTS
jgi:hypothetical protein